MNKIKIGVTTRRIFGMGDNLYLVNWSCGANFGFNLIYGNSEKEVFEGHYFSKNKNVNFIITKISKTDLPVVFQRTHK